MQSSTDIPVQVQIARGLFFANAIIWLLLANLTLARTASTPDVWVAPLLSAALMSGNAILMLISGVGVGRQKRLFFFLGAALLVVNIVFTVTDQVGFWDILTLLVDAALLGLLIVTRAFYIRQK